MKKYILLLLIAVFSVPFATAQSLQNSAKGVVASVESYKYDSDSVFLTVNVDLREIQLSSSESVVITPKIFKNEDKSFDLPTLVVRGRNGSVLYRRTHALDNKRRVEDYNEAYGTPREIVEYYGEGLKNINNEGGIYTYEYSMPYETWMVDSEILLGCQTYGCCHGEDNGLIVPQSDNALAINMLVVDAYNVIPSVSLIKPEKVAEKRRDIKYSSALIFRVNSSYIDPNLANNQKELNSIDSMMQSVVSDPDYTITGVNISGFASPEGTLASNQRLSERRAKALETILKGKYSIAHNLYDVHFGGENWDALIPMVEASDMKDKERVLDIIKNVSIENGRETKLMQLSGGVPYRYMLKNYFPKVRLVVVDVEFNVDAYDLDRIKEVINVKPENLSLEEMYRLSETYDVDSDEFLNIFLKAVEIYPNDEVALHNAIVTDIKKGDIESAAKFAQKLDENTDSAEVLNTLGSYFMMASDYAKAEELLQRASDLGSVEAASNLEQLKLKLENLKQIEESEVLRKKIYGE